MNKKGFTLIELLIVIAIIGIVAAIAIPNLIMALQRGKQKATVATLKNIGGAIDSYITNVEFCPHPGSGGVILDTIDQTLEPFYIKVLPTRDAWQNDMYYWSGQATDPANRDSYTVRSYGKDGIATGYDLANNNYVVDTRVGFNLDIIYSNGAFTYGPRA
jgi:type II secretion system protein G